MFIRVRYFTVYRINSEYHKDECLRCRDLVDKYRMSKYSQVPKNLVLVGDASDISGSYICSTKLESDTFIDFARDNQLKLWIIDYLKSSPKELTKAGYLYLNVKEGRFFEDEEHELFYNTPYQDRLMGKIRLNQVNADSTEGGFMDNYRPLRLVLSTSKSSKRDIFNQGPRYIVRRWLKEKMQAEHFTGVRYEPCLKLGKTYSEAERYIGGGDIQRLAEEADFFELIVTQRTQGTFKVRGLHSLWLLDQLDGVARVTQDGQLWPQVLEERQIRLEHAEALVAAIENPLPVRWPDFYDEQEERQKLKEAKAAAVYAKQCLEILHQPLTSYVSSYEAEYSYFNPGDLVNADFQEPWLLEIEGVGVHPRQGPFEVIVSPRVYQFWRQEKVTGLYSYYRPVPVAGEEFSHES